MSYDSPFYVGHAMLWILHLINRRRERERRALNKLLCQSLPFSCILVTFLPVFISLIIFVLSKSLESFIPTFIIHDGLFFILEHHIHTCVMNKQGLDKVQEILIWVLSLIFA
jgi:hypothetical protein